MPLGNYQKSNKPLLQEQDQTSPPESHLMVILNPSQHRLSAFHVHML